MNRFDEILQEKGHVEYDEFCQLRNEIVEILSRNKLSIAQSRYVLEYTMMSIVNSTVVSPIGAQES